MPKLVKTREEYQEYIWEKYPSDDDLELRLELMEAFDFLTGEHDRKEKRRKETANLIRDKLIKERSIETNTIIKIENYKFNQALKEGTIETVSNAHDFMSRFYNSDEITRKHKNPFNISEDLIRLSFGEHNFIDDHKISKWWVFMYKGNKFFIDIHETEGSSMYMKIEDKENFDNKEFSDTMLDFYRALFDTIL